MISDSEMAALHNLADKQAGKDVDWIKIADARALTELGLARRNRGGWEITPQGLALLNGAETGRARRCDARRAGNADGAGVRPLSYS